MWGYLGIWDLQNEKMFVYLRPILNDRDKEGIGNRKGKYKLFEIFRPQP